MAKKTDQIEDTAVPVTVVAEEVTNVVAPKMLTFDQWAQRKKLPHHHLAGMRAFVANLNKPRSQEAWDKLFENY